MKHQKRRLRTVELGSVIAILVVLALVLLPAFRSGYLAFDPRLCQANLKQWGVIFDMYRQENRWYYPPVHGFTSLGAAANQYDCTYLNEEFDFSPNLETIYPGYATDLALLVCPRGSDWKPAKTLGPITLRRPRADAQALGIVPEKRHFRDKRPLKITHGDMSYTYLGWRIDKGNDGDSFIDAHMAKRFRFPATGPAQVVAMLAHLDPARPYRSLIQMDPRAVVDVRDLGVDLRVIFSELPPSWQNRGTDGGVAIMRLWAGFFFQETLEGLGMGSGLPVGVAQTPPPRPGEATTAVMWDTIYKDSAGTPQFVHQSPDGATVGANVLFLDGHVEFCEYPGQFPVSKAFVSMEPVR